MDLRCVNHIIIKERGSETFWGMDVTGSQEYETRLRAIKATADTLLVRLKAYPVFTDYGAFQKTVLGDYEAATAKDSPMTQWIEIHSLEQDQADHTIRHRTADEYMAFRRDQDVTRFLDGRQLSACMFESLLRRYGLWAKIPIRTKAFVGRQLSTITREGEYISEPEDCRKGNPLIASLAVSLTKALETGVHEEPEQRPIDWYTYQVVEVSAVVRDYDGDDEPVWQWYDSKVIGEGKMRAVNMRNIAEALWRHGVRRPKGHTVITSVYGYDDCLFEVRAKRRNKPLYAVYIDDETTRDKETRQAAEADEAPGLVSETVNF